VQLELRLLISHLQYEIILDDQIEPNVITGVLKCRRKQKSQSEILRCYASGIEGGEKITMNEGGLRWPLEAGKAQGQFSLRAFRGNANN